MLLDTATTIGDTLELGTLIRRIVAKTVEVLACERSSFFVLDHEGRENADLLGQIARVYEAGLAALQYDLELRTSDGESSTVNAHVLPLADASEVMVYEVLGEHDYRLTPAQEHFLTGIESYRARKFREAYRWFQHGADEDEDGACRAFARRCVKLMVTAPPADWDGVWRPAWK